MFTTPEQIMELNKNIVTKTQEMNLTMQKVYKNAIENRNLRVGETPAEVIYRDNKMKLLNYRPETEEVYETPLLVIYALINKPYVLDLQPDKSVVRNLISHGFDTYLIDWGTPSDTDRYLDFEDYIERYIDDCVDVVRERTGMDKISIMGYCIGGTLASIYSALNPDKVANFIMMASPVYFNTKDGPLHIWTDRSYFDADKIVDTIGNLPPEMLNTAFLSLDPADNYINKYIVYSTNLDNPKFVQRFLRMEHWIYDSIPMPGEFYRRYIKELYQQDLLARGMFYIGNRRVNLKNINMPFLNIIAERDTQVPMAASAKLNELISSSDKDMFVFPSGHIGLSVGSKAHRELWPKVGDWLSSRSGKKVKAREY